MSDQKAVAHCIRLLLPENQPVQIVQSERTNATDAHDFTEGSTSFQESRILFSHKRPYKYRNRGEQSNSQSRSNISRTDSEEKFAFQSFPRGVSCSWVK